MLAFLPGNLEHFTRKKHGQSTYALPVPCHSPKGHMQPPGLRSHTLNLFKVFNPEFVKPCNQIRPCCLLHVRACCQTAALRYIVPAYTHKHNKRGFQLIATGAAFHFFDLRPCLGYLFRCHCDLGNIKMPLA